MTRALYVKVGSRILKCVAIHSLEPVVAALRSFRDNGNLPMTTVHFLKGARTGAAPSPGRRPPCRNAAYQSRQPSFAFRITSMRIYSSSRGIYRNRVEGLCLDYCLSSGQSNLQAGSSDGLQFRQLHLLCGAAEHELSQVSLC